MFPDKEYVQLRRGIGVKLYVNCANLSFDTIDLIFHASLIVVSFYECATETWQEKSKRISILPLMSFNFMPQLDFPYLFSFSGIQIGMLRTN